ncbi:methyl-accepting chemotaxis protein [Desulfobacterales bacterium HSG17]|nr:methyl-accepting chemotaxis protein [Desulfobacterales bacterium HSG17]
MFRNMKIGTKLFSSFLIILILLCIVAFAGYISLKNAEESLKISTHVNDMVREIFEAGQAEKNYIISHDDDSYNKVKNHIENIVSNAQKLKIRFSEKNNLNQMDTVIKRVKEYLEVFTQYADLHKLRQIMMTDLKGQAELTLIHIENIREEQITGLFNARKNMAALLTDKMTKADDAGNLIKWFLEARRFEKEYIINNGDDAWLEVHQESILKIMSLANDLKSRLINKKDISQLGNAIAAVKIYDGAFGRDYSLMEWQNELMNRMKIQADNALRLIENIRNKQNIHLAETVKSNKNLLDGIITRTDDINRLNGFFLDIRKYEKNYIISNGEKKYLDSYSQVMNKINEILLRIKSNLNQDTGMKQENDLASALQAYNEAFMKFSRLFKRYNQVIGIMNERADEALEQIHAVENRQKLQLAQAYEENEIFIDDKMEMADNAARLTNWFIETRRNIKEYIITKEQKYFYLAEESTEENLKLARDMKIRFKSSENIEMIDQAIQDIQKYKETFTNYMNFIKQQNAARKIMETAAVEARQVCTKARERQKTLIDKQINIANWIMISCTLTAILIGFLTAFFISRSISKSISKILKIANDIASGDFTQEIKILRKDEIGELAQTLGDMKDKIKYVLRETETLIGNIQEGRLDLRGNAEAFSGSWQQLILGVNNVVDAFTSPISMTARTIDRISKGDIPQIITDEYKGDFNEIKNNLNSLISNLSGTVQIAEKIAAGDLSVEVPILSDKDLMGKSLDVMVNTLQSIVMDINILTESAVEGDLDTRGDAARFKGEYAGIIKGINNILNAVIMPIYMTAEYIARISRGDIPKNISSEYKGDFIEIKNNLTILTSTTKNVTMIAQEIAAGNLKVKAEKRSQQDELMKALDDMITYLANVAHITEKISKKDLNVTVVPKSNKDILNNSLHRMVTNLQQMMDEIDTSMKAVEEQNRFKTGLAELGNKMRGDQDAANLAQNIITWLADWLNAQIGAIYLSDDKGLLHLTGTYAWHKRKGNSSLLKPGQSLVGQAALEKQSILFTQVPHDYIRINSGIGAVVPDNILVLPFLYEGETKGVIELGTAHNFSDTDMDFLDRAAEDIAIAFNTAQTRGQMQELLETA